MTRKNIRSNEGNSPFLLKPVGKEILWGGRRLNDDFSKGIDLSPLAETWECSTHPDGPSTVASGPFAGQTLAEVLRARPEFLGTDCRGEKELPILIKLVDAERDLSIQVHPTDEYAKLHEKGQRGKTEFWYVLDAAKDAHIVYGFANDVDEQLVRDAIENATLERLLQMIPVHKDDLFMIKAGTVHAIGAGTLLVEIQQNSNLTYRLYDYDRTDKHGDKRPLHIEKALAVAELGSSTRPRQPLRMLRYRQGCASELLCRCKYFEVSRLLINTERCRSMVSYRADGDSFRVLLCTDGCGSLLFADQTLPFFRGDCLFVPAASAEILLHGRAQLLDVRV